MATLFRETPSHLAWPSGMSTCLRKISPAGQARRSWTTATHIQQLVAGRRALSMTPACHARLIQRPQRPYQFTQIVQLSDGSTFTMRTTSPYALHRCTKDSRNHVLWQPTEKSLRNVEVDEAGRLAAFRSRFGRGWDASQEESNDVDSPKQQKEAKGPEAPAAPEEPSQEAFDTLADLLSGYAAKEEPSKRGGLSAKEQARKDKKKK